MILDSEKQRKNLLSMIAAVPLSAGNLAQQRQAVAEMEALQKAVREATIREPESVPE